MGVVCPPAARPQALAPAKVIPAPQTSATDPFCAPGTVNTNRVQPAGTRRMIERLARLRSEADPSQMAFMMNAEAAEILRQALSHTSSPQEAMRLHMMLAAHLLRSGQNEKALQQFTQLEKNVAQFGLKFTPQERIQLNIDKAMCHLRIGEQENCLTNHTTESCLLPIREAGIHRLTRGSRGAVQALTEHLRAFPDDLRGRWLLNIAHMTLGEYPDQVPPPWLIPPSVFAAEYDIKRFPDVAGAVGLDVNGLAGGSITEDFDGDGYLDVMTSDQGWNGQLRLFRNNADGTFSDRTVHAGLMGLTGGLNILQTDYNNDGFPDVLVLRGAWLGPAGCMPNSLLKNNRDGTFEDVTEAAGMLSFHPTQTAAWLDYNGDGWLDVFIGNESWLDDRELHPCELYHNNGDGTFTECARELGVAVQQEIKGVAAGDFNNDGRPDLYLSNRDGLNYLLRNDGPMDTGNPAKTKWKFTNVAVQAGVAEPIHSFPTAFFDYNNDGWEDILVCGYAIKDVSDVAADYLGLSQPGERPRLYRNNGDGSFTDATASARLYKIIHAMGLNYGDLDNDGWLDFYAGTGNPDLDTLIPNRMFRNAGGKFFQEVTTSGGFGHIQKGHGISFADLDNDGDQDVHAVMGGAFTGDTYRHALFRNPGHGHHWITLKLEGRTSNRAAIGARIRVTVATPDGEQVVHKTVSTGASFGASPLRQEIGLGQATAIRQVEIHWPTTGQTQVFNGLAMDRIYKIREGQEQAVVWELKSFVLPDGNGHHKHAHAQTPVLDGASQ